MRGRDEGSDLPLRAVLDAVELPLPAGAKDVHCVTHSPAAPQVTGLDGNSP